MEDRANFRHEYKHRISAADVVILRQRLRLFAKPDPYADADVTYQIRSLYFDNVYDQALREKIDGVNHREKFRLRIYNGDPLHTSLTPYEKFCYAMLQFAERCIGK